MNFFQRLFGRKDSQVRHMIAMDLAGRPAPADRKYEDYAKEGYGQNVIAFRCINLIAEAVSRIPLCMYRRTKKEPELVDDHPFLTLIKNPNPTQTGQELRAARMSFLLISGNAYLELNAPGNPMVAPPTELWTQRPDIFTIIPGLNGLPAEYVCKRGAQKVVFPVTILGLSAIVHQKLFHPTDFWYGQAPLLTAAYDIDQLNEGKIWNIGLLKRGARPSLAIIVKAQDGQPGTLTQNQRDELRKDAERMYAGSRNAGRMMLLEGGADVKELSQTAKDMEFPTINKLSQKDVALVFGVPGQLIGLQDSQTEANFEQANLGFYRDTVIPWAEKEVALYNSRIIPRYGDEALYLDIDRDQIPALAPERDKLWVRAEATTFLTTNEKRHMVDLGRYSEDEELADRDAGDVILTAVGQSPLEVVAAPALIGDVDPGDYVDPNAEDGADDGDQGTEDDAGGKSIKAKVSLINLPSHAAKVAAAKALDALRQRYENHLGKQIFALFMKQKRALKSAFSKKLSADVVSLVVTQTLAKTDAVLYGSLEASIRAIADAVGRPMLMEGGSKGLNIGTKDADSIFDHALEMFIEREVGNKVTRVQGTTHKRVVAAIRDAMDDAQQEGEGLAFIAAAIEEKFAGMSTARAATIARTETHNAMSFSLMKAAEALKLPNMTKEWVPVEDDRTRDGHAEMADYGPIELHEAFMVPSKDGADQMDRPGDPAAPADQVINCRCVLVFSTGDGNEEE